jgi:hypothetical protein
MTQPISPFEPMPQLPSNAEDITKTHADAPTSYITEAAD